MAKKRIKRAVSVDELLKKKFEKFQFEGKLKELLGAPEKTGHWFIYGESGHGKTTLIMQIVKELTKFDRVEYNTLEEGARASMQDVVRENNFKQVKKGRFKVLNKMPIADLKERLRRHKSAKIIVIDSAQYTFLTKKEYFQLDQEFGHKHLFIWNSHARGNRPIGSLAEAIMYHGDATLFVKGFRAFVEKGRGNRGKLTEPYTIWEKGAKDYWNLEI